MIALIILLVWIIPIIIIGLLLYAAMGKDESIEEFVETNDLDDSDFLCPFLIPVVNIIFMCYIACKVGYDKCKHWRKKIMEVYKILANYVEIGTKLYSTIWGEVEFLGINPVNNIMLNAFDGKHLIYPNGKYTEKGEVILFPSKENKDWDSLIKFKKGDVICSRCFPNLLAVFDHYKFGDTIVYSAVLYSDDELKIKLDTGLGTQSSVKLTDEVGQKRMIEALNKVGYFINSDGDVVLKKFNIKELKPFDKVLVRDGNSGIWRAATYSFYDEKERLFVCECYWEQCIPYNDDTKHLLGTDQDCPEHYKNWK